MKPVNYRNSVHVRPVRGGAELRVYGGITVLFAKAKAVTQALQLKVPSMTVPSQVRGATASIAIAGRIASRSSWKATGPRSPARCKPSRSSLILNPLVVDRA